MNESLIILYDKFERDFTTAGIGILIISYEICDAYMATVPSIGLVIL